MMLPYENLFVPPVTDYSKKAKRFYDDNIFTFDIETTSLFNFNGKWCSFLYDDDVNYDDIPKAAVPYIWMFGVNDTKYYGREFADFEKVLKAISNPMYCRVVWIQNLAFEFGYLPQILNKYTITEMIAREKRKPIQFYVPELNIMFRCSYMLTNMSLENAAKEYTKVEKKVGDLYYNVKRSPLTKLSETELGYCEADIDTLYYIIKHFRDKYNGIAKIPLTSTSTVRAAIKEEVDVYYIRNQQKLVPKPAMYLRLWWAFSGGYTHANVINSGKIIKGHIKSYDIASSYPTVMVTEKFPCKPFRKARVQEFFDEKKRSTYAFLLKVRFKNLDSKYYNHYLQYEKVKINVVNPCTDNGRIISCDECTYWLTDVDYDIMCENYCMDEPEILECYKSYKDYLDIRIIKFILKLYGNKTGLKGYTLDDVESVDELEQIESIYRNSKSLINGIYGMSVTSILHTACYVGHEWTIPDTLDPEKNKGKTYDEMFADFVEEKLEESKTSFSTLFFYAVGVWVTAYARRNLVMRLFSSHEFDRSVIYMDTDSCKFTGDFEWIFEEYNKTVYQKYLQTIKRYSELKLSDFMPKDKKGHEHPIGFFELDEEMIEFCTHGAKKYAFRDTEGKLHITVSGVSKKGVSALNDDIRNFKKNFKWGYSTSGKLMHTYVENQDDITFTDIDGNTYTSHQRYSVVLQPTSYTLGLSDFYELLLKWFDNGKMMRYLP